VTVDTALRLVRYFGGDVKSWLYLQIAHEIKITEATKKSKIDREVMPKAA
jgi:plasmid maintenance system antidote protein VapI